MAGLGGIGLGLGGFAEGLQSQEGINIAQQRTNIDQQTNQQRLQLLQTQMKNEQQRELLARADQHIADFWKILNNGVEHAKLVGQDNLTISKSFQPLLQAVKQTRQASGQDPSIDDAMFAALLATPGPEPIDRPAGQPSTSSTAPQPQPSQGTYVPPTQNQNITQPGETSYSVTAEPEQTFDAQGRPVASPASSRTQPQDDVARLTRLLETTDPKNVSRRQAIEIRLREAIQLANEKPEIKMVTGLGGQQEMKAVYPRSGRVVDVVDSSMAGKDQQRVKAAFEADLHGADFLKALPAEDRNFVKGVATYKINPMTSSVRGGRRETLMGWVTQYNPEYNQTVFTSENRAMQAIGQREGQIVGALENAKATAPIVKATSQAISRTQFPSLNAVILAAQQGTGGENVVRYGVAINTLINNYARALGAGTAVLTDSARKEATEILQKAWSQGQINAAVDQMLIEIERELSGTKTALSTVRQQFGEDQAAPAPSTAAPAKGGGAKLPPPPPGAVIINQ